MADVIALEARGWKGRRATALLYDDRGRAFSEAVVGALAARGAVTIDRLMVGDRTVAGLISFRLARRAWIWKTAYDEDFARHSP
ncbi:GNAT family N-acetyltransferase, partial [Mycobacterium tuberculosis]|nr:GNAT family N-acetyltransferase [Mycobacterium tuberculosis]